MSKKSRQKRRNRKCRVRGIVRKAVRRLLGRNNEIVIMISEDEWKEMCELNGWNDKGKVL